jgi:hypothetical protein
MTKRVHSAVYSLRHYRRLALLARMREAKARKRLANAAEREPVLERWCPMELGLRDKRNGETAWVDFRGLRDALRRLTVIRKYYL